MTQTSVILVLAVVTAPAFDFTNGFHDTANAVILTSSHLGLALSTTHVATGSILGSGV